MVEVDVPLDMLHEGFEVDRLLLILGEEGIQLCDAYNKLLLLGYISFGQLCESLIASWVFSKICHSDGSFLSCFFCL